MGKVLEESIKITLKLIIYIKLEEDMTKLTKSEIC
jgi:hypothetical protein